MQRDSKPRFLWQGLLIILPSILLAAFGLYSLRQDSVLAEHEVRTKAEGLARGWSEEVLPQLFLPKPSNFETEALGANAEFNGDFPLDAELRGFPSIVISRNDSLVFPHPSDHWPTPQPTFDLPQGTQELMRAAEKAFSEAQWTEAMHAFVQVVSAPETPPQTAALAKYRWALSLAQSGSNTPARSAFQQLINTPLSYRGESGIPLATLASLRILGLEPTPAQAISALDHAAFASLREPSPLTPAILLKLREAALGMRSTSSQILLNRLKLWNELWERHELLRNLADPAVTWLQERPSEPALKWITNSLTLPVLLSAKTKGDLRCGVWPMDVLSARLRDEQTARGWPSDCALVLSIAGRSVLEVDHPGPTLATLSQGTAKSGWIGSIHLANPAEFHARQLARSRRFGIVIGLGLITVLIGFVNARRAYLRQIALAEMRTNFVSSVSHELRAPIAAVRLLSEELAELTPADHAKAAEYQQLILRECRRLSGLIENVLDFSRNEQGRKEYQFESIDLAALVQATAQLMRIHAAERGITLKCEIGTGPDFDMEADGQALQQVVVNLLDNAIKHSPANSEITVKLRRDQGGLIMEVLDQGEGISPSELPRIFDRFYRCGSELTRRTPGVGLGLAIAKYIVEAHHGTITAHSVVGNGSTFTVRLPSPTL